MEEHKIEFFRMTKNTVIKPFSCTDKDLTEFLLEEAHNYLNDLMAVTYFLTLFQGCYSRLPGRY